MKSKELLLACVMCMHPFGSVQAQGTFQNLGFESASLVPIPGDGYGSVEFAAAFPGWTSTVGGFQWNSALHNNYFLDSSGISIIDTGWPHYLGSTAGVIGGNFTALLQAGLFLGSSTTPADTTLSQTSLVPVSTESLRFRAYTLTTFNALRVFLNGQSLSFIPLATGTNYTLFGADIHTWQGQTAQLDFTLIAMRPHVINHYLFLDSIVFSPQPIPEPGVIGLIGLGAFLFATRFVVRSQHQQLPAHFYRYLSQ